MSTMRLLRISQFLLFEPFFFFFSHQHIDKQVPRQQLNIFVLHQDQKNIIWLAQHKLLPNSLVSNYKALSLCK